MADAVVGAGAGAGGGVDGAGAGAGAIDGAGARAHVGVAGAGAEYFVRNSPISSVSTSLAFSTSAISSSDTFFSLISALIF